MPIDPVSGMWLPERSPKQIEVARLCREPTGHKKIILVDGPRKSGKTRGALHAIIEHAWHVKNAAVCVLCPTIPTGSSSGVWNELTERVIPEWIEADFGLDWAPREIGSPTAKRKFTPQTDGATKRQYCYLTNKHGGRSRLELNSLQDERDIEKAYHNRYFSMIYWSEMCQTREEATFATLLLSLRAYGVEQNELVLLGDTNPDPELGDEHWLYKRFYEFRLADDIPEKRRHFQRLLRHLHMGLDDNPYLSEDEKEEIRETYREDPIAFACFAEGRWVKTGIGTTLFSGQFRRGLHVIETTGPANDPQVLVPEEDCFELLTGWDIGQSNHAVEFAEKIWVPYGDTDLLLPAFKFFDEVVIIKGVMDIVELTELVMERMDAWEEFLGHEVDWKFWSDRSSLDQRQSISNRFPWQEVIDASDGEIMLHGVDNTRGSLGPMVRLWRKMLKQERLLFSETGCPKLVEMNTSLKAKTQGRARSNLEPHQDTVADSVHKHPFDAARYIVMAECYEELMTSIVGKGKLRLTGKRNRRNRTQKLNSRRFVHVPL